MKWEEKSHIHREENNCAKFLREVREGCRKHVKSSLQLWLEVKREEIGSEAPQIKFKFAVPTSSLGSTLADHPPHCSNRATSDLMSWVWDVRRPVNETVYHCNTLIRYLIEHLFWKLRNRTEKLALKYHLLYLENKKWENMLALGNSELLVALFGWLFNLSLGRFEAGD